MIVKFKLFSFIYGKSFALEVPAVDEQLALFSGTLLLMSRAAKHGILVDIHSGALDFKEVVQRKRSEVVSILVVGRLFCEIPQQSLLVFQSLFMDLFGLFQTT